jgi:hypothetical protein
MTRLVAIPNLDPQSYQRHCLHGDDVVWVEKNCYGDLWIELLHALRLEPLAVMPFTLAVDFEGDQWTFFKPPHDELRDLYGVDVQELTVWRPLLEHAIEHLGAGRLISTEADAFWLPDTSGTDYRNTHTKTTIVMVDLDVEAKQLGYFHNAGYFRLEGEDFVKTFRLDAPSPDPTFLPLFAEVVRTDRIKRLPDSELARLAWPLLPRHFERRPLTNPLRRFGERFARDLPDLQAKGLAYYHAWGFATIRQAGAAFDLAAAHLRWQAQHGHADLLPAAESFNVIAQGNKALILKAARAVNSKKPFDAAPMFDDMAQAWDRGMDALGKVLARS